jgi:peptidyl-prolyl cis-trans isomerase C
MRKNALESLISRELLYQEAQKSGITADENTANSELERFKSQFQDKKNYAMALSDMKMTEDELKTLLGNEWALKQFVEKRFSDKAEVTDAEAREYFDRNPDVFKRPEQVKASHILIKVEPGADEAQTAAAHEKMKNIEGRIEKGEAFADLARANSQCPSSSRGGDLGYFGRGQMVKPFEDVAFSLNKDEMSGIVKTDFGYHLIKTTDKKPATAMTYEDVKDDLKKQMSQQKLQQMLIPYMEELKQKAKVERILE